MIKIDPKSNKSDPRTLPRNLFSGRGEKTEEKTAARLPVRKSEAPQLVGVQILLLWVPSPRQYNRYASIIILYLKLTRL